MEKLNVFLYYLQTNLLTLCTLTVNIDYIVWACCIALRHKFPAFFSPRLLVPFIVTFSVHFMYMYTHTYNYISAYSTVSSTCTVGRYVIVRALYSSDPVSECACTVLCSHWRTHSILCTVHRSRDRSAFDRG